VISKVIVAMVELKPFTTLTCLMLVKYDSMCHTSKQCICQHKAV
jgi:hypothetical protein